MNFQIINAQNYLSTNLGVATSAEYLRDVRLNELPLALISQYELYQIIILDRKFILATVNGSAKEGASMNDMHAVASALPVTVDQLSKHFDMINKVMGLPCILVTNSLEAYVRQRLIEKKIPFILPGKQMYLPHLMIELREFGTRPQPQPTTMAPATQMLFLYHLQKESLEGMNFKGLADKFLLDGMTISRAAQYFNNTGLAEIEGTKDKYLKFSDSKQSLWEKALPYLISPVKHVGFFSGYTPEDGLRKTNISALAHYTSINAEQREYFACTSIKWNFLEGVNFQPSNALEANYCIEVWKYDPTCLSKDGCVDKLSLYLSLRHHQDERVQIALDELMNKVKW